MNQRVQTVVIASMAVVIAVLVWALIYFARDELHLRAKAPEDEVPLQSALSRQGGSAAVRLSKESQAASGIVVRALEEARAGAAAEVYGVIVNVQPLIDLRARYGAAVLDARSLRAAASNSASEYQRLKRLFEDDRTFRSAQCRPPRLSGRRIRRDSRALSRRPLRRKTRYARDG